MISTRYFDSASLDSTQARAGGLPGDTHASHTEFISAKSAILDSHTFAESGFVVSLPAPASSESMVT